MAESGEGLDPIPPPPPHQTCRFFETEILTSTGCCITFHMDDFFLMKCALHFATILNSMDIQKSNFVFGYPFMIRSPLLAKQYFQCQRRPRFTYHKKWSYLLEVICHKKVQQSFLNQSLSPPQPPPPQSKIPGSTLSKA